jgi:DNA-binding CsgD family transcriptional regulator
MMAMSCERIAPTRLPAVMCLSTDGTVVFATVEARKMHELWNAGLKECEKRRASQDFKLPAGIAGLLRAASGSGWDAHTGGVRVRHPTIPELTVTLHMGDSLPAVRLRPHCLLMFAVDSEGRAEGEAASGAERMLRQLSPSERRVALLVAEGLCNEEIAQRLQRSRRTVEYQLNAIFRKLDMNRRTQLVRVLV